jgi:sugar fermentation stimulation protein A
MFPSVEKVDREVKLGYSRIDFLVNGRDYLEVKTPLKDIPCEGHPNFKGHNDAPVQPERMLKHFSDTGSAIKDGSRALFLLCHMYDAPPFKTPPPEVRDERIVTAVQQAEARGIENWQANFTIDAEGVSLIDCFQLRLF